MSILIKLLISVIIFIFLLSFGIGFNILLDYIREKLNNDFLLSVSILGIMFILVYIWITISWKSDG